MESGSVRSFNATVVGALGVALYTYAIFAFAVNSDVVCGLDM